MLYKLQYKIIFVCLLCMSVICFGACQDTEQPENSSSSEPVNDVSDQVSAVSNDDSSNVASSYESTDESEVGGEAVGLDELLDQVYETALEPKEPYPSEPLAPGTKTPPECLHQATDELIGKEMSIKTEAENDIVFAFYPKTDKRGETLVILYSDVDLEESILLLLETDYGDFASLLDEDLCLTGTVNNVKIIDAFDYMYPKNALPSEDSSIDNEYEICFGKIDKDGIAAYSAEKFEDSHVFEDVYSRFDIELP